MNEQRPAGKTRLHFPRAGGEECPENGGYRLSKLLAMREGNFSIWRAFSRGSAPSQL